MGGSVAASLINGPGHWLAGAKSKRSSLALTPRPVHIRVWQHTDSGEPVPHPSNPRAAAGPSGNLRGILAMIAANAILSANDACLKLASSSLPTGELIFIRNGFATLLALGVVAATGALRELPALPPRQMLWRTITDMIGTLFFIAALVRLPFADAVAIHQILPLAITAAAAIFLRETVGWRRWLATAIGFCGATLIVRPGTSAFQPASVLALISVAGIAARDLITRRIPGTASAPLLAMISMATILAASLGFLPFETWRWPDQRELMLLAASGIMLYIGYGLIIVAMRAGEVAAVVPFRYTLVIWAILGGWLLWHELPDLQTLVGTGIVVGAGLYTLHREQMRRRNAGGG
jgi:drug/metabolite transporter (DMT)-like permease